MLFFKNENIEDVIIPNSVKEIKDRAFLDCKKLKSVEFSKNLVSIGEYAFSGCDKLEEVAIPKNTSIAENAFNEDVDIITTGQRVLNNITKGFFKHFFLYNAVIIVFGILIPIYISKKRGEDGHLSSEYLKEHKYTSIAYYIAIGFAVLFMIPLMHMLIGDTYSDFIEGTLFTFALGGFLISSVIWMLMEIIRSDFPWGISRVLIRLGKLILITTISIIPIAIFTAILNGITLQVVLYIFAASVFIILLSVIDYLIPSSPSSGSSGIIPPGVGESSRSIWDIINSGDDEKDPTFIQYGDMSEMPNFTYSKNGNFIHTRDMDGRERNLYKYDDGHYKDEDTGEDFFIKD